MRLQRRAAGTRKTGFPAPHHSRAQGTHGRGAGLPPSDLPVYIDPHMDNHIRSMTLRQRARVAACLLVAAALVYGCGSEGAEEARQAFDSSSSSSPSSLPAGHPPLGGTSETAQSPAPGQAASSVAGMAWTPPAQWEAMGARAMRAATYTIRTNREGTAECAVFFFGAGQGGDVQANIDRWINQFEQPDGTPSAEHAKTSRAEQAGWPLTRVEVAGTYTAGMGPAGSQTPQAGYRLLGAIVEGPGGAVFFKLTGPEAVVEDSRDEFEALLASIRPVA